MKQRKSKEEVYDNAMRDKAAGLYLAALDGFMSIKGYKDAEEQAEECRNLRETARDEEAAFRIEQVKKRSRKRMTVAAVILIAVIMIPTVYATNILVSHIRYNNALDLYNKGDYAGAMERFKRLRDYENSRKMTAESIAMILSDRDTISFSGYDWIVLDRQEDRMLIITEKVIDTMAYHYEEDVEVTWETCSLREYLNGEFLAGFSEDDRARIIQVTNKNHGNPWTGAVGGNDTQDYIFLLSTDELVWYFGGGQYGYNPPVNPMGTSDPLDRIRVAYHIGGTYTTRGRVTAQTVEAGEDWYWWLRSPGYKNTSAAYVFKNGYIHHTVGFPAYVQWYGIRPALWLTYP